MEKRKLITDLHEGQWFRFVDGDDSVYYVVSTLPWIIEDSDGLQYTEDEMEDWFTREITVC